MLLFCLLNLQDLLHNLLLFHQKGTDDSFPDSSSRQYSTISTVHSPPVSGQSGPLIFSRSQMRNPLNSLASHRTLRSTSSFLRALVHQLPSRGFDDAVLVRFGGIAVPLPVRKPLNHFSLSLLASSACHGLLFILRATRCSLQSVELPSVPSSLLFTVSHTQHFPAVRRASVSVISHSCSPSATRRRWSCRTAVEDSSTFTDNQLTCFGHGRRFTAANL